MSVEKLEGFVFDLKKTFHPPVILQCILPNISLSFFVQ